MFKQIARAVTFSAAGIVGIAAASTSVLVNAAADQQVTQATAVVSDLATSSKMLSAVKPEIRDAKLAFSFVLEEKSIEIHPGQQLINRDSVALAEDWDIERELTAYATREYRDLEYDLRAIHDVLEEAGDDEFIASVRATRLANGMSVPLKLGANTLATLKKKKIEYVLVVRGDRFSLRDWRSADAQADVNLSTMFVLYDVNKQEQVHADYLTMGGELQLSFGNKSIDKNIQSSLQLSSKAWMSRLINATIPHYYAPHSSQQSSQQSSPASDATPKISMLISRK